jgi:acetyl-CoA acetyltransferase
MADIALVAGVGMTAFSTPSKGESYIEVAPRAIRDAIADAGLDYCDIEEAYAGYVYGDSTAGQYALYQVGMTGIPVVNVNNNCSTGSSALYLANQAVSSGRVDCALAFGFEQMSPGAIGSIFTDRPSPLSHFDMVGETIQGAFPDKVPAAVLFGGAGIEHMEKYGTRPETFAKISVKARRHAEFNERAVFRSLLTIEEVLEAPEVFGPLTRFQCCPPTTGAAAALVVSEEFARKRGLNRLVAIRGQAMTTDTPSSFEDESMMKLVGSDMTKAAANMVYEQAGIGPEDVDVAELHDCFTANELITYEGLGFAAEGEAERFILDDQNTYGGAVVTNPSGGLLSKGHPLGATGLAQCAELTWQLRGEAGRRQVDGAKVALQHNLGLGGACVVTLYGPA